MLLSCGRFLGCALLAHSCRAGRPAIDSGGPVPSPQPRPQWVNMLAILYAMGLFLYTGVAFVQESQHSSGVTRRRMRAVALGSFALGTLFVLLGVLAFFPDTNRSLTWLLDLVQLCAEISFFIG